MLPTLGELATVGVFIFCAFGFVFMLYWGGNWWSGTNQQAPEVQVQSFEVRREQPDKQKIIIWTAK